MTVHQVLLGIEADTDDRNSHDAHSHGRQILLRHPPRSGLRCRNGAPKQKIVADGQCATEATHWIGEHHLRKAFQHYFCFPKSSTPMGNDFSDFQQYFIKCTIPQALAKIKDGSGDTRNNVKLFLIKILKFNDNSNNYVPPPPSPVCFHPVRG
jgi:hypothetical protein